MDTIEANRVKYPMKTIEANGVRYQVDTIEINGVKYQVIEKSAEKLDGLEYVIVRTYSAGVFAGYLKERKGKEGVLLKSRRLWFWEGAASLSQLANEGVSKPNKCKFPAEIKGEHIVTEIIEVIPTTEKARESINKVKVWEE